MSIFLITSENDNDVSLIGQKTQMGLPADNDTRNVLSFLHEYSRYN